MGILNVTPDSFSDGGLFLNQSKAYEQASLMIKNGATIIDIGGESTRPGSKIVNEKKDEWNRIKNIIIKVKKKIFQNNFIFRYKKILCNEKRYRNCGINIINDVSGLNFDKKSFNIINSKKIPFILHHMQGTPDTMQKNPKYNDALLDILIFLKKKLIFV